MMIAKLILTAILSAASIFADVLQNGCVVDARAYQILHAAGVWTKLVRFVYEGSYPSGHVVCVYSLANNDLWFYDHNFGSKPLGTKSHDISEIGKALANFYKGEAAATFIDE